MSCFDGLAVLAAIGTETEILLGPSGPANMRRPSGTMTTPSFAIRSAGAPVTSLPSNRIVPFLGRNKPEMARSKVVLPAPLGPRMVTISSLSTSSDISRWTTTAP